MSFRLCVKDYEFDYDGKKFTIEKDKNFYIPIYGIMHDERYFKDPERFDPERFSDENRASIDPDTYLPFGEFITFKGMQRLIMRKFVYFRNRPT